MINKKSQYISLEKSLESVAGNAEVNYYPEVRTIKLSGKRWGWVWNHPRGIVVQKDEHRKRVPIIDFTRLIQGVVYAISFLLFTIGAIKKYARSGGENHG